ncbi:Para-nitrobenzyl esterase [Oryzias melastigma]|uniref:Para-nitrobenzyl esterase n=1 Tax=Oryzias melastigma TaxID=30732 RepID=A0A834CWY7_ORYME|nr:Para-nitrobenzyl esterase [Oryzias melastigma]
MDEEGFEVPRRTEYRYLVQDEEEEEVQYVQRRHYISPFLVLSKRCIFLICLGVLALLALAVYLGYMAQTLPPGLARVLTHCGEFRGRHKSGAYSFKGIPYAAPPVGALRWAPPADPVCRSGVMEAGRFRSVCPQVMPMSSEGKVTGQEDCLFINVWTPTLRPDAQLPVMVWIHGGYLQVLSGGEQGYSPTGGAGCRDGNRLRQLQLQTQRLRLHGSGAAERRFSKEHLRELRLSGSDFCSEVGPEEHPCLWRRSWKSHHIWTELGRDSPSGP